jgi:hypothetical protein
MRKDGKMIVETESGFRKGEVDPRPYSKRCGPTEGVAKPGRGSFLPAGDNGVGYRTR